MCAPLTRACASPQALRVLAKAMGPTLLLVGALATTACAHRDGEARKKVLAHAQGSSDVLLARHVGGGGMVPYDGPCDWPPYVPEFVLYGDGTIIFRGPADSSSPDVPQTRRLDEDQVQELLHAAVEALGDADAHHQYRDLLVMDAGSDVFEIATGGLHKKVEVNALQETELARESGLAVWFRDLIRGTHRGRDLRTVAKVRALAARLSSLGPDSPAPRVAYEAPLYRATSCKATEQAGRAWPWREFTPAELVFDGFGSAEMVLTADQARRAGLDSAPRREPRVLSAPDGRDVYTMSPLQPVYPEDATTKPGPAAPR